MNISDLKDIIFEAEISGKNIDKIYNGLSGRVHKDRLRISSEIIKDIKNGKSSSYISGKFVIKKSIIKQIIEETFRCKR